jgi:ribonuclease HI
VYSTRRYPLRKSQLARIQRFRDQLEDVAPLSTLFPDEAISSSEALTRGAILVAGTLMDAASSRWLAAESRQRAAVQAKLCEKQAALMRQFRDKGLKRKEDGWRYAETVPVGAFTAKLEASFAPEDYYPSAISLRKALKEGRRQVRRQAALLEPLAASSVTSVERIALRYPQSFDKSKALVALEQVLRTSLRDPLHATEALNRSIRKIARTAQDAARNLRKDQVELHVGRATTGRSETLLCLVLKVPGQKVRVTFRSGRGKLQNVVGTFLRAHASALDGRPVTVFSAAELHGPLRSIEELGGSLARFEPARDKRVGATARAYRQYWEGAVPESVRKNCISACPAPSPQRLTVFSDASHSRKASGIASVIYVPGGDVPVVVAHKATGDNVAVLEAKAILLGLETIEQQFPAARARILTDNQYVVSDFEALRDTGLLSATLRKAAGTRDSEWLFDMANKHSIGWVPGHSGIDGNELADHHANRGRSAKGPVWV